MKNGFVYIWMDSKKNMFYIGSHYGNIDDGYVCSSKRMMLAYNKRPFSFRRKIIENVIFEDHRKLIEREQYWLSMINANELGVRYYNEKNVATGGDIISNLSEEKRKMHKIRSMNARRKGWEIWIKSVSKDKLSERAKYARSKVKKPSGGKMPGEKNPFYGKKHSEETKIKMSNAAKSRKIKTTEYTIKFPDGHIKEFNSMKSILDEYKNLPHKFKLGRFIDTGIPIKSNRKTAECHPLLGAIINKK